MRIIDMRPEVTEFDDRDLTCGFKTKVHNWSFRDITCFHPADGHTHQHREIWHHETYMGNYSRKMYKAGEPGAWVFTPISIGHGSVSDQNGMNQLMSVRGSWGKDGFVLHRDYGYRYSRDQRGGGPRIEHVGSGEIVKD
jgi:hypothetical protein